MTLDSLNAFTVTFTPRSVLWKYTCFVMQYIVFFLVLQSSCWGREGRLLYFNHLLAVVWLLVFCVSSSWCRGLVCSVCDCGISWSYSLTFHACQSNYLFCISTLFMHLFPLRYTLPYSFTLIFALNCKFPIRGSSNKFWQWSHISETVIEIRILLPIACGHGCCLFMFEI